MVDRPEYWNAMTTLTNAACGVYGSSPYYHVGPMAGEARRGPQEQAFLAKNGLRNSNDYYRWYP